MSKRLRWRHSLAGFLVLCLLSYLFFSHSWHSKLYENNFIHTGRVSNRNESMFLGADVAKRNAVIGMFKNAWGAYERDAMGSDEYHPISKKGSNITKSGGIGYTVLDAIDTMFLMGLEDEYLRSRKWVLNDLTFDRDGVYSTFETTIRVLGGLLAIYNLTNDHLYLSSAVDLTDRLVTTFDTDSGLPLPSVNLKTREGVPDKYRPNIISTAEATTLQLEFRYIAELTKKSDYWYKAEKVMELVDKAHMQHHLVPIYMNLDDATFSKSEIRLGSRGDSYYEYLLKQYLQTGRTELIYKKVNPIRSAVWAVPNVFQMYQESMQGVHDELVRKSVPRGMTYIAELMPHGKDWNISPKQDHLVCFFAGSLMLGATTIGARASYVSVPPLQKELTAVGWRDWNTGVELLETCIYTHQTTTGLSPEIAMFRTEKDDQEKDWYIKGSRKGGPSSYDARYMLRPETVESLFIAWRLTGDMRYRTYAWSIFTAIEANCGVGTGGYATILDVDTGGQLDDKQETFFLSETLKYLFMTFSNSSLLPLNEYVFNTEAHPLPIFIPSIVPRFK